MKWIVFLTFSVCAGAVDQIVRTAYGPVRGTLEKTVNGMEYLAFYGIPFAASPVGSLRLKPPVEPKLWTHVRNSTQRPACLQPSSSGEAVGDEDCLYLNIFTPLNRLGTNNSSLPVMVFIFGGAFRSGDSLQYKSGYILEKPVILATINYRLGSLGFLGYGTDELSGNFGLKDQSFALRWVKTNIAAFGGNPNEVTIFGESAGSASVHLHTFSPLSKGLFQRAIMESGVANSFWCTFKIDDARALTTAFGVVTGCYRKNITQMVSCFQKLKPTEFIKAQIKLYAWGSEPVILFRPIIEGEGVKDAALPKEPTAENYQSHSIPVITGINTGEGAFRVVEYIKNEGKLTRELNEEYQRLLPLILQYQFNTNPEKIDQITNKLKEYYFQNRSIALDTDVELVKMLTDSFFLHPVGEFLKHYPATKYFYVFDHKFNCSGKAGGLGCFNAEYGTSHGEELPLLFEAKSRLPYNKMTAAEKFLSAKLVEFWTNFAIYGDPNGLATNKQWHPFTSQRREYLHITTNEIKMKNDYNAERLEFWGKLFPEN